MLGVLPFFHSFGFTGTLWFPMITGFGVAYHPNPTDAKTIGELADDSIAATLLISTPTFCAAYIRKIRPEQFAHASLRDRRRRTPARADGDGVQGKVRPRRSSKATAAPKWRRSSPSTCRTTPRRATCAVGHGRPPLPGSPRRSSTPTTGEGPLVDKEGCCSSRAEPDARLPGRAGADQRRRCATAGTSPATSRRSTRTASSASPIACRASARSPARWCRT